MKFFNNAIPKTVAGIIMFFLCSFSMGYTQIKSDLDFIMANNPISLVKESEHFKASYKHSSERQLFLIGFIRFYQNFIGSQQNNKRVCTFTPGCSDFTIEAIERYGAFYGTLMGSDRILRCNSYERKHTFYEFNFQTRKMNDPVEPYQHLLFLK